MNCNEMSKEQMTNYARISGRVVDKPKLSHQIEGESFFEFKVVVDRLSKVCDTIPVTISERTLMGQEINSGDFVEVVGEYRSYNKLCNEKSKLVLHLFAKSCERLQEENFVNEVRLIGFLCKEPIYRKTPFNREICDILLAINRTNYHKSDYIPCILWGRNARFIAEQPVGSKIEIVGRIQSREYVKTFENGQSEVKTAYEVSCQKVSLFSNVETINKGSAEIEMVGV